MTTTFEKHLKAFLGMKDDDASRVHITFEERDVLTFWKWLSAYKTGCPNGEIDVHGKLLTKNGNCMYYNIFSHIFHHNKEEA